MFFSNKRILITGGLGFIGSNLARALVHQGAKVTLIDSLIPQYGGNNFNIADFKNEVLINISDIRDTYSLQYLIKDQEFVFNLAGQTSHLDSMTDPKTDLDINAAAQLNLLEVCRTKNPDTKIVFASTRQLYGKPDYLPVDEKHPTRPVDVNGINKLAGEWYHLLYNNIYGLRTCALRLTNTYGSGMRVKDARQTFLGVWVRRIIEHNPIEIFGDGLQKRDFNHVDDCVNALLLAAQSDKANGKVYNLGSEEIVDLFSLAQMMIELSPGAKFNMIPFPPDRKAIDIGDYYSDFSLIRRELGWQPKMNLSKGLSKTIQYYKEHHRHYWDLHS